MTYGIIIPARIGSTRFPEKPLALINGKPMIVRTVESALSCVRDGFTGVCVATDDSRIEQAVLSEFGSRVAVVMTPPELPNGTARCAAALEILGWNCEVIVNLQGDEPFIQASQVFSLLDCFSGDAFTVPTDIATLKIELSPADLPNPNRVKVVCGIHRQALYFSRSPIPFHRNASSLKNYRHIGMYAYRSHILTQLPTLSETPLELAESLEQLRWLEHGLRITLAETNYESPSIDTPEDLGAVNGFR
ncbi:MAG: 3-deoxy-manno-octulosonate cytidylyltransferase [Bacteroidia bacterium]|nr:3-deoxy-manno-octulosonate cytidylyltransferase [Bacteroidia bacterium]